MLTDSPPMTIRVVGAGLGRTGTHSLKVALEQLLGAPCYHMIEVFAHPEHVASWHAAMRDEPVDWDRLFDGYAAAVDFPVAAVWEPVAARYPDAPVLLSTRSSTDAWWRSARDTILAPRDRTEGLEAWEAMATEMFTKVSADPQDEATTKAAYERHNAHVRATVPADRLIDWRPEDGWGPLCEGLRLPVPDQPFPHTNTTAEFRAMAGLDE
jgi:hypothetical protein